MTNWYADDALWAGEDAKRHAGNKAREDVTAILKDMGMSPLPVIAEEAHCAEGNALQKLRTHREIAKAWDEAFSKAQAGDAVIVQFPPVNHTLDFGPIVEQHAKRGVHIVLLVHDLEAVRAVVDTGLSHAARFRIMREEIIPLKKCGAVIAHNAAMAKVLIDEFGVRRSRIIELGLFDYLAPGKAASTRIAHGEPVAVCGALRRDKAGYAYKLPRAPRFNLYGPGFDGEAQPNVTYHGSFFPEQLQDIVEGSFGLVWDGPDASACSGAYGKYLRVNNPHKASLYLSMGMPVITWSQSALAAFVESAGVGFAVGSLDELEETLGAVDEERYTSMQDAALGLASKLRAGFHTRKAVEEALKLGDRNSFDITVITPFYEGTDYLPKLRKCMSENAAFLRAGIDDAGESSSSSLEWVIVNDSPWVDLDVASIEVEGVACTVVVQAENQGIHAARAAGLRESTGELVMFLDQDDEILPECLLTLALYMGDADVAVCNARSQQEDGSWEDLYTKRSDLAKVSSFGYYLRITNAIQSPGQCLIRKRAIPGSWTEHVIQSNGSDDLLLWMLMLGEDAKFITIPDRLYLHKYTGANISGSSEAIGSSSFEVADALCEQGALSKQQEKALRRSIAWHLDGSERRNPANIDLVFARIKWKLGDSLSQKI